MKVIYEVEDGYAGKSRPQTVTIDDSEFNSEMADDEIKDIISDAVDDHFANHIYPACDIYKYVEEVKKKF